MGRGLLVAILPLTACSGGAPVADPATAPAPAPADAMADNTVAHDAVLAALEERLPEVVWREKGRYPLVTEQPDGRCLLFLREDLGTGPDADELYDGTDGLAALGESLDPVLREHDYAALQASTDDHGGAVRATSHGPAGWKMEIELRGTTLLMATVGPVAADRCDASLLLEDVAGDGGTG